MVPSPAAALRSNVGGRRLTHTCLAGFMNSGDDIAAAMASAPPGSCRPPGWPPRCADPLAAAAGKLPTGSKEAQDLAWDRTFSFLKKHL